MKLLAVFLLSAPSFCSGFSVPGKAQIVTQIRRSRVVEEYGLSASASDDDKDSSSWDDDVDYDKVWDSKKEDKMPTSEWNDSDPSSPKDDKLELPQEVSDMLLFDEETASEIKAEARKIIEEKSQLGLESLQKMRTDLREEAESQRRSKQRSREANAERESAALMKRIDAKADAFLESTRSARESTKRAAEADANMEGQGISYGSWGTLENGAIVTTSMLGSIENTKKKQRQEEDGTTTTADDGTKNASTQNRVLIIGDESSGDQAAKRLIPIFRERLEGMLSVEVEVVKPTQIMPLGGNDAACVIFFLTSLNSNPQMERLLQRTMLADGSIGKPPTQFIGVSTAGTTRTGKMPYSMQNLLSGGKLTDRFDMEEYIRNNVINRNPDEIDSGLDYTIVKFGELKDNNNEFTFMPGDVLDGATSIDTAAQVLLQAMALQPLARNSTLCATGNLPDEVPNLLWDDAFLKLRGPELRRFDDDRINSIPNELFFQLTEYLKEWGQLLLKSQKLTTPAVYEPSTLGPNAALEGVAQRDGFKLVFETTRTGGNYLNKQEERKLEKKGVKTGNMQLRQQPEGGIEVLIEITSEDRLRVRATRTNMSPKTIIKELSETSILRRLKESLDEFVKLYA